MNTEVCPRDDFFGDFFWWWLFFHEHKRKKLILNVYSGREWFQFIFRKGKRMLSRRQKVAEKFVALQQQDYLWKGRRHCFRLHYRRATSKIKIQLHTRDRTNHLAVFNSFEFIRPKSVSKSFDILKFLWDYQKYLKTTVLFTKSVQDPLQVKLFL